MMCLCIFCLHLDDVIGLWTPTPRTIFLTSFYWKLGYNMSYSEGLVDFLAFLVPKLWPKCHKLIRQIPTNPYSIPKKFGIFWP